MTRSVWIKGVVFWASMFALAYIWLQWHNMGRGSRLDVLIAFGPLIGVVVVLAFVLGIEIGFRRGPRDKI